MARLQGRTLFFITSPRTPMKMLPEIEILVSNFTNQIWNTKCQEDFMKCLATDPNFEGVGSPKDLAFSARDRINRGPKALGFVNLNPTISITEAGKNFLNEETAEEALLRQLLKFQLPSPYHTETENLSNVFSVKPYLEIFRLIYTLGKVTFDELMIFGMQLTNYKKFDEVVDKIKKFREERKKSSKSYRVFMGEYRDAEIEKIYQCEIHEGKTKTRESKDASLTKFVKTKSSNMRDYTDACFRYLRATGLVTISQKGKSLSILPEKIEEVKYFLKNIERKPIYVTDEKAYKEYLFDSTLPVLYTDNRESLEQEVGKLQEVSADVIKKSSVIELKKTLKQAVVRRKENLIKDQVMRLKDYQSYIDVMSVFGDIKDNNYYDVPLMLEWNTWRAMTMLDGGDIRANLKFDDNGQPMATASGNTADIICDYGDFSLTVEVTMQSGQRQYEMEGEPVSRHLAKVKKEQGKDAYCFFIAPKINDSCIAHFYTLHLANIAFYGGKSIILPLELEVFEKMVEQSGKVDYTPNPDQVRSLCEYSMKAAQAASSEKEWYAAVKARALNWLTA
ncbi:MAG: AlwI family type II restriction endonuclease [Ruminococcaceae bacterium]|nr:AlwI family type II restriction endonuclease [Oscillospiraceae bacterium]